MNVLKNSFGVDDKENFDYFDKITQIANYFLKKSAYYKNWYIALTLTKLVSVSFIPLYLIVSFCYSDLMNSDIVTAVCSFLIAVSEGISISMHCEEKRINYMKTVNYLHAEQRCYKSDTGPYFELCAKQKENLFTNSCELILREETEIWDEYIRNEKKIDS